jgi:hypothetical protein
MLNVIVGALVKNGSFGFVKVQANNSNSHSNQQTKILRHKHTSSFYNFILSNKIFILYQPYFTIYI